MKDNIMLNIENLSLSFGGLKVLDNFNLKVRENELYGLIGPNGAGKTTVFNLLTGIYKPTNGKIMLNDINRIDGENIIDINKMGIARTFQNIRLFHNLTVFDNIKTALQNKYRYSLIAGLLKLPKYYKYEFLMNKETIALLRIFDLDKYSTYKSLTLPYGKQRKLEIARAIATNPKLLLLDEPAAGMNESETKELMNTIKLVKNKFNITVLLIEHDMKFIKEICDEITVLNFGKVIAQGKVEKVLNNKEVIKSYLGD